VRVIARGKPPPEPPDVDDYASAQEAINTLLRGLDDLEKWGTDSELPTIISLGDQQYRLNDNAGRVVRVTDAQDDVLQAFLSSSRHGVAGSLDTKELVRRSKRTYPGRHIADLLKGVLAPAIKPAVKRGSGGYVVRIRQADGAQE
jgi:hypothetical protein